MRWTHPGYHGFARQVLVNTDAASWDMTFYSHWRMFSQSRKPVKVVCSRTWLIFRGRMVGPGVRDFQIHTVQYLPLLHGSKGGTRWGKKCYGQEEGPKTWGQSSFQTLLFLNQQYPNVSLLTVSSWQLLMPISCYLRVFFSYLYLSHLNASLSLSCLNFLLDFTEW